METKPRRRRTELPQLTDADRLMLEFAAEQRFVIDVQLAALTGCDEEAAAERAQALTAGGWLREAWGEGQSPAQWPAAAQITARGLQAIGSELRAAPRPAAIATFDHELAAGWLMLAARRGRFGAVAAVVGERRMRSHDARHRERSERFGVHIGRGPGGRPRLHHPDMVMLTSSGHRVAFEIERTGKGPGDRARILGAYASDARIDAVVYLVDNLSTGRAVERVAKSFGISELVHVQLARLGPGRPPASRGASAEHRHVPRRRSPDAGLER